MGPTRSETERWKEVPKVDIYDAENQLFQTLRVAKSREFPLDLVFVVIPYLLLLSTLSASFDALRKFRGGYRSFGDLLGSLGAWAVVVLAFYAPFKYYRQRRTAQKM